ncbi:PAS domain-containing sensor histidine kinase [Paenibacillus sp. R14(2021)]|uniref:PAS domain-containing sensor histidine kinase n=1 Tax=Paenibacillus sp. R14(2021) TaxID=2859228 RepID=UPI001C6120A2|nr:PAS domain-containing sensor histidine kinase [Paenibacillus sp. R14(2021)]
MIPKEYLVNSFMQLTSDGIVIVDVNGTVLEVNRKFEELHGWTRDEVIGQVLPMTPDQDKEDVFRLYRSLINGEQSKNFEALKLRKDGSTFYANVAVSPLIDNEGTVIGFIGVERDISEKKKAEAELLEREQQFKRLIKLNPEPIVLHKDGIIQFMNDAGCLLLSSLLEEEFKGKSIYEFLCPSDKPLVIKRLRQVKRSDNYTDFLEIKMKKLDGTFIDVEVSSIYVHKNLGFPVVQTVIRDLSERKKSEETIIRSEKLSLIGQLAAGIAHDIRNPLTSLKGFLRLLMAKNVDYVDVMMEELEHINYVVNEFMSLAKPQTNDFNASSSRELIKSVISFLQPHAHLYNVQIQLDMEPNIPSINCNPDQMKQVLINVVKNAIESMPSGGAIKIVFLNDRDQSLIIRIADEGIGIAEESLSQLGEPFFTTKTNGTGLGLMVCKRIIEGHGGTLSIHSQINQGTTVEITLPYRR